MKTLKVSEVAGDFERVLTDLEQSGETVALTRDDHVVARLIPESTGMTAPEMFADLAGTLKDESGDALLEAVQKGRREQTAGLEELKNPWGS